MTIPNIRPGTMVRPKFQIQLHRSNEPADEFHTWHPSQEAKVAGWIETGRGEYRILERYSKDWVPVILWEQVFAVPFERVEVVKDEVCDGKDNDCNGKDDECDGRVDADGDQCMCSTCVRGW